MTQKNSDSLMTAAAHALAIGDPLLALQRIALRDASHRVRLRVEIGRLRNAIRPLAGIDATDRGFVVKPHDARSVVVLVPPVADEHLEVLTLLADGEAWSSSALALALDTSPRTIQRALGVLADKGKVESFGQGRSRRWLTSSVPSFPTSLLLPAVRETR